MAYTATDLLLDELASSVESLSWQRDAACVERTGDADWFPEQGASTRLAKEICAGCLVRTECLSYALNAEIDHGIWGALSPKERRALRRKPKAA